MNEKKVSLRYARALFELATELKVTEKIIEDFSNINHIINISKDFQMLLENPVIKPELKKTIIKSIFGEKITELTMKLLLIITEKGREILIPSIANQYFIIYNQKNNRLPVNIITANNIDEKQKESIIIKLNSWLKKEIIPEFTVDKSIIGGIKFSFSDKIIDNSVKNQLQKIKSNMILNN